MWRYWSLLLLMLLTVGMLVFYRLSAPSLSISIAAGPQGGGYHLSAQRYQKALARRGVALTIIETAGAQDNLDLISRSDTRLDAALVQGGLSQGRDFSNLFSTGRPFYEPLLIFTHSRLGRIDRIAALTGKRIAIGAAGTGTQVLSRSLLTASGLSEGSAILLPMAAEVARDKLLEGAIDAAMFVMAIDAPVVQSLLASKVVSIVSITRAEAYARKFGYLTHVSLPEGSIDLMANVPPARVELVASTAAVLVRNDLHPALINVLTEAVSDTHRGENLLGNLSRDAREHDPEYQMADAAMRYYRHGVPFLHRHFRFWIADFLERLLLIGLPAMAVLVPMIGGTARLYQWHWQHKIQDWSRRLIDFQAASEQPGSSEQLRAMEAGIMQILSEIRGTRFPAFYADQLLQLSEQAQSIRTRIARSYAPSTTGPWS